MEKGDSFRVLEVIKSWILHCDAKAGLVLATDAVLFGFATTQVHGIADFLAADYSPHLKCLLIFLGLGFVIMGAWNRNVLMMIIGIILIVIRGFVVTNKNK